MPHTWTCTGIPGQRTCTEFLCLHLPKSKTSCTHIPALYSAEEGHTYTPEGTCPTNSLTPPAWGSMHLHQFLHLLGDTFLPTRGPLPPLFSLPPAFLCLGPCHSYICDRTSAGYLTAAPPPLATCSATGAATSYTCTLASGPSTAPLPYLWRLPLHLYHCYTAEFLYLDKLELPLLLTYYLPGTACLSAHAPALLLTSATGYLYSLLDSVLLACTACLSLTNTAALPHKCTCLPGSLGISCTRLRTAPAPACTCLGTSYLPLVLPLPAMGQER